MENQKHRNMKTEKEAVSMKFSIPKNRLGNLSQKYVSSIELTVNDAHKQVNIMEIDSFPNQFLVRKSSKSFIEPMVRVGGKEVLLYKGLEIEQVNGKVFPILSIFLERMDNGKLNKIEFTIWQRLKASDILT